MEQRAVQQFLAAQFDEPPFALVLVNGTGEQLWIGPADAGELCDPAGFPTHVQHNVEDDFERVGEPVWGLASAKQESATIDGMGSLTESAATEYRTLAANARRTHGTR